ncbi:cation diffusion facilitator family transporter [Solirubrobacter ginsenosidimutans]|uniref:Cation diffusion facilitator family transporter n=1 Tax=Solirubrobacter ginsenosidimutans TaxID=490573 RepID=A0A9X3N2H1_9ACTN|nr:cation diffusion facilitator family transporter [Solirubrobacter ginsenosidimutans]MDA0165457.1 cation diffusion facilitator family transporter [Solirubrobacter ginsenosidimutans]
MAGRTLNGDRTVAASHEETRDRARSRAATISILSNTALIVLKVVAGVLTGSVAILTEALHSAIDLLASFIAFFSVRRAEEPADASHRYGHEKFENAAAAAEGMLILAGSAVIAFAAIRALIHGPHLERLGIGIVVIGVASAANLAVSSWLFRRARETNSPALHGDASHLRTDAYTSIGVLVGLGLVSVTGAHWLDPVVALIIAAAIVVTGTRITMGSLRVLVDEALPDEELEVIRRAIESFSDRGVVGYHQLRTRQAGARRYVDLHVQFAHGTTLEEAHRIGHELQDSIEADLQGADVLIHLEPEDRVRPDEALR